MKRMRRVVLWTIGALLASSSLAAQDVSAAGATCPNCGGQGQLYCSACNGNGKTSCGFCYGLGRKNGSMCSWCFGSGGDRCMSCSGMGIVSCTTCGGSGMVNADEANVTIDLNGVTFLGPYTNTGFLANDYAAYVLLEQRQDGLWYVILAGDSYPNGVRLVIEQDPRIQRALREEVRGVAGVAVYYSNDPGERDRLWRGVLKAMTDWDGETLRQ